MVRTQPSAKTTAPRKRWIPPAGPTPITLIEAAPEFLLCPVCDTQRLARTDHTLLWHQVRRDGTAYECPGTGLQGLDPEEVAA